MKRLAFVLCTFVSPVWAIGFWQDVKLGVVSGGIGEVCLNTNFDNFCNNVSTSGFLLGGTLNAGISLKPLVPIALGLGLDYYMGDLVYKLETGQASDTSRTSRLYVKLPVAYQISFLNIKSKIGLYPAYSIYNLHEENDRLTFTGFSLGVFGDLYYQMGLLGFGGGVFMEYGFKLGRKEGEIEQSVKVFQYGINLGINLSFGILE